MADRPNWAWGTMQQWIIEKVGDRYDFYTDFLHYHRKAPPEGLRARFGYYRRRLKMDYYRDKFKNASMFGSCPGSGV